MFSDRSTPTHCVVYGARAYPSPSVPGIPLSTNRATYPGEHPRPARIVQEPHALATLLVLVLDPVGADEGPPRLDALDELRDGLLVLAVIVRRQGTCRTSAFLQAVDMSDEDAGMVPGALVGFGAGAEARDVLGCSSSARMDAGGERQSRRGGSEMLHLGIPSPSGTGLRVSTRDVISQPFPSRIA